MIGLLAMAAVLVQPGRIELQGRNIRARDVEVSSHGGDAIIAQIPPDRSSVILSNQALVRLLARANLTVQTGTPAAEYVFVVSANPVRGEQCWNARRLIPEGRAIDQDDVTASPCTTSLEALHGLRTERGQTIAMSAVPAGASLGRLLLSRRKAVSAGEAVTLVSRIGPVTIERDVVALQNGEAGRRIFVRDRERRIFAADLSSGLAP